MKAPIALSISWLAVAASLLPLGILLVLNAWLAKEIFPIGAAAIWLASVLIFRRVLSGPHRKGIRLVKKGDFTSAIPAFQESYAEMSRRSWVDRYRWFILGSSSRWSYREMALANCAFCFGQVGDGKRMKEYYEKTLSEFPESVLATTALRMLDSAAQKKTPNSEGSDSPERESGPRLNKP